MKKIKW